jgi:hypothetical protein
VPVWQTVVIYAVIPLAIVLFLAALTLPGGRKGPRWKSGQPWPHEPVWYEPHPEALGEHGGGHGEGDGHAALTPGHAPAAVLDAGPSAGAVGATAADDGGARRVVGGPLGGARGTW